ncbi:MAG: HTH domain-containing protein, partial [Chitinivibrionales bacterium]|nr:HTH domain-containing protein [Chitinivibrionales bacterium]
MPAEYSRVHRLLRILTLVQSRRGWNAARYSRELHTAERTIYRDLKVIEAAGIPVHFDESTQGYAVRRDFFVPPVQLTLAESLAMVVLAEQVGVERLLPFTGPAQRAVAKLRASLPHAFQDALDSITPHIEVDLAACQHGDGFADVYEIVRSAIASRRALQCRYESIRASLLD